MNKSFLLFSALLLSFSSLYAGDTAVYFQQKVDSRIEVTLDDVSHYLRGTIVMEYHNNAPDTLREIYMHLWPNAYSNDRTAYNKQAVENGATDFYKAKKEDWGFIDSLDFTVDDVSASTLPTQHSDVIRLVLNEPIFPGDKIRIRTPFRVQIPTTFSRLGHAGQSYQITQWFPKPAVYDKNGWNPMPYLDQGEFFSEFGSYDVSITLPQNYVVIATGNLETPSEQIFLDELAHRDVSAFSKEKDIPSASALKTIRFTEDNIHDFAWFADKRWVVRKESFTIPETQSKVTAYAAFYPEHIKGWSKSIQNLKSTTLFYSKKVGPYPYQTIKAVEGPLIAGGGMEYPTVTIIIPTNNPQLVSQVITHEAGHNWFYGILANNERQHPWLDESINSFYEEAHVQDGFGVGKLIEESLTDHYRVTHQSQAVNEHATAFTHANYGLDVYKSGSLYFKYLNAYLGTETFDRAMRQYFDTYRFKHVYPIDMQQTFEQVSGEDLSWFFQDLLSHKGPVDFSIKKVKTEGNQTLLTVRNNSTIQLPALVLLQNGDADTPLSKVVKIPPFIGTTTVSIPNDGTTFTEAKISKDNYDNVANNNYYRKGSANHLKVTPFLHLNSNDAAYNYLSIAPALGYNTYDGFMLGALFHNISIPYRKFTYALAPMYGFRSKKAVGTGFLSYTQYTPHSKMLHHLEYKIEGKSFGYDDNDINDAARVTARYVKIAPQVTFTFQKPYARSPLTRSLIAKGYWVNEQNIDFNMDPIDSLYRPSLGSYQSQAYAKLQYNHQYESTYNPYGFKVEAQAGKSFIKLMAEANAKIDYHYQNKALYVRGFLGKFFKMSNAPLDYYRYRLTSTYSAANDYMYDHTFLARSENEGFWSRQIAMQEGGMKIPTLMYANQLGMSENWMGVVNVKSDLPLRNVPIRLFADISTFTDAKFNNPSGAKFLWNAGFEVYLSNVLQVYIPVVYSQDYKDYLKSIHGKNAFWGGISFQLNLNNINWSKPLESSGLMNLMR